MSLAVESRPKALKGVIGNEAAKTKVENLLSREKGKIPQTFLLVGPTGCGKTTMARIIAKMLGCEGSDYTEVDQATFRGIDSVREIRSQMAFRPAMSSCRVWLLDECHKMTNDAQNAFLKALEEPPAHVYFILATTDPQKLIPTLKGRCQQIDMSLLKEDEMLLLLQRTAKRMGTTFPEATLLKIVDKAQGHPRNALHFLDGLIGAPEEQVDALLEKSNAEEEEAISLCRALMAGKDWKEVAKILSNLEQEPESVRRCVLGYCQSVLLKAKNPRAYLIMDAFREPLYDIGKPGLTMACYEAMHG